MLRSLLFLIGALLPYAIQAQNRDPLKTQLITEDIPRFWQAFDAFEAGGGEKAFQNLYLKPGSSGVRGFTKMRIQNAAYLARVVGRRRAYYASARSSTQRIDSLRPAIIDALVKLKEIYPEAVFPPVFFVIGALNSGGTTSGAGLIIGAEMYGRTDATPDSVLTPWLRTVLQPVDLIPHIVAHEVVHFQQSYDGGSLLQASLKEGSADFIAELISGQHINTHVHAFANPREEELWLEFKARMHKPSYDGWLYSSAPGRPNDLGYWMGYKITRAYYEKATDKQQAIRDIIRMKNPKQFLEQSGYAARFTR